MNRVLDSRGIRELLESYELAQDCGKPVIQFSLEISQLRRCALGDSRLRWLIEKGLLTHAIETSIVSADTRKFHEIAGVVFEDRSCFYLTERGFEVIQKNLSDCISLSVDPALAMLPPSNTSPEKRILGGNNIAFQFAVVKPIWNAARQELKFLGKLVKKFSGPSKNQICVLNAFQEENWPDRVFDPMKPKEGVDSRRRLNDTVKGLNNKQRSKLIRFRCDGSGEGVTWEPVENSEPEQESRN